jgi:hypothetical protein
MNFPAAPAQSINDGYPSGSGSATLFLRYGTENQVIEIIAHLGRVNLLALDSRPLCS